MADLWGATDATPRNDPGTRACYALYDGQGRACAAIDDAIERWKKRRIANGRRRRTALVRAHDKIAHELAMGSGAGGSARPARGRNTCAELPLARPQQPGELPVLPVQRPDAGAVQ